MLLFGNNIIAHESWSKKDPEDNIEEVMKKINKCGKYRDFV